MKHFNIISIIFLLSYAINLHSQSGTSNFSGTDKGFRFSGSINYKAECQLGNPYISVSTSPIRLISYTYNGKTYTDNSIPGYTFPIMLKDGLIRMSVLFQYGTNSTLQTNTKSLYIKSKMESGLANAYMGDIFGWADDAKAKATMKNHGTNCTDWGNYLGRLIEIDVKDVGTSNLQYKLDEAIEKLLKQNEVDELIEKGESNFFRQNYQAAENNFKSVLNIDSNNTKAHERLEEIRNIREKKEKEETFNSFIETGDDYFASEEYDEAMSYYEKAGQMNINNDLASSKIKETQASILSKQRDQQEKEQQLEDERLEKEKERQKQLDNEKNDRLNREAEKKKREAEEEKKQKEKLESQKKGYEARYALQGSYTNLKGDINVMRANGQINTPQYKQSMELLKKIEMRLGVSGANSYYYQMKMKEPFDYINSYFQVSNQVSQSYDNYKKYVENATRITSKQNPRAIIEEFDIKIRELERIHEIRLKERLKEVEMAYQQQSAYNSTAMEQAGTDLGTAIVKMTLPNQIRKEKEKAKKKLYNQKERLLEEIRDDLVNDFERNRKNYYKRAAIEVDPSMELYYKDMYNYFACMKNEVQERFSVDDYDWVNPECNEVYQPNVAKKYNFTAKEIFEASVRKFDTSDPIYMENSKKLAEMAIEANPDNAAFYFHRSRYEEIGTQAHIDLLKTTVEKNPEHIRALDYLDYSLAEKKRFEETTYFDNKWNLTERKNASFYRPLETEMDGLYSVKYFYSSNDQLLSEGFAPKVSNSPYTQTYIGKATYYHGNGSPAGFAYYTNDGVLKQRVSLHASTNLGGKLYFYNGQENILYNIDNDVNDYGSLEDIIYADEGFIKELKFTYYSNEKKRYNRFYRFYFDDDGTLLYRDVLNDKGRVTEKIVAPTIPASIEGAKSFMKEEKYKQAIEILENGLTYYPKSPDLYYYLGLAQSLNKNLFSELGNIVNDKLNFGSSSKISKNDQFVIDNYNKGIIYCEDNLELKMNLYRGLGDFYAELGQHSNASEIFEKALELQPNDTEVLNSYSKSLTESVKNLDIAEEMILKCLSFNSENYRYLDTYGWVLYKQGRYEQALKALDDALIYSNKKVPMIWEHKGDVSYRLGNKYEAVNLWKRAKIARKEHGGNVSKNLNLKVKKKMLVE